MDDVSELPMHSGKLPITERALKLLLQSVSIPKIESSDETRCYLLSCLARQWCFKEGQIRGVINQIELQAPKDFFKNFLEN